MSKELTTNQTKYLMATLRQESNGWKYSNGKDWLYFNNYIQARTQALNEYNEIMVAIQEQRQCSREQAEALYGEWLDNIYEEI